VGRVEDRLAQRCSEGPIHFTLIDPDKSSGARAGAIAAGAEALGSDAVLLGGSTGISTEKMGATARAIKAASQLPVVIFPEGPVSLTAEADALLFMSLLNSRNLDLVIRLHARSAPHIQRIGLEPIPLGYIVVEPGMRVGEVGSADAVPRDRPDVAAGYALAAEYLGMRWVYLEAGSGAPSPVPVDMVRAVRAAIRIPLIVGGGIRSGPEARALLDAGASALVTGTVTEEEGLGAGFRAILEEVRRDRDRR
jgi:phosphoglycerol geranylgeranyltransferase